MSNIKYNIMLIVLLISGCINTNSSINNSDIILSSENSINSSIYESSSSKNISSTYIESSKTQTYKVTFMDGSKIIYEQEGLPGEFVKIPDDLINEDSRIIFLGWEGIDEFDKELGMVEIFESNQVFNARWEEMFGTNNVYSAVKLNENQNINVDGIKDDIYDNATEILINEVAYGNTEINAKAYIMWNESYLYLFADVKDSNVISIDNNYGGKHLIEHYDAFEMWIDLLHDDSLASNSWTGGWGGTYRGEPGPMCEAHFKINPGFIPTSTNRFGNGSEACWDGWWSNECNNDGDTMGYSLITETGYTVEYKINAKNNNIPEYLRLSNRDEIGIGIKIHDKNVEDTSTDRRDNRAPNAIVLEYINADMSGPKKLSNFKLLNN